MPPSGCGTPSPPGPSSPTSTSSRSPRPKPTSAAIVETFTPYVEARDWVSINRGTVVGFTEDGFQVVGPASEMGELS